MTAGRPDVRQPPTSVVKLGRGPWSRLFGDAVFGWAGGSQFLTIAVTALLVPIHGWEWVPVLAIAGFAVLAMSYTYELRGTRLVGKAFGFVVLDADLRGASVTIEPVPIGFVATSEVVVISDATIHRRISLVARGHYPLTLGYGTWIGREQRQRWLREISSRS